MSTGEVIEKSLKEWLDENLPSFLQRVNEAMPSEAPWEMPIVEDYVLIVAIKDFKDGLGGVFAIGDSNVPRYRIRGLLNDALDI